MQVTVTAYADEQVTSSFIIPGTLVADAMLSTMVRSDKLHRRVWSMLWVQQGRGAQIGQGGDKAV